MQICLTLFLSIVTSMDFTILKKVEKLCFRPIKEQQKSKNKQQENIY